MLAIRNCTGVSYCAVRQAVGAKTLLHGLPVGMVSAILATAKDEVGKWRGRRPDMFASSAAMSH